MEPSGLIFVALAVAWGAYLVPKVLKHHEEAQRSRSVDDFSEQMRIVARRDAVSSRDSQLIVTAPRSGAGVSESVSESVTGSVLEGAAAGASPMVRSPARRAAARRAARRRRNVLMTILAAVLITAGAAGLSLISWWYVAIPATTVIAWLVACRLMVKRERSVWVPSTRADIDHSVAPVGRTGPAATVSASDDDTQSIPAVAEAGLPSMDLTGEIQVLADDDPSRWDMIPVTLPTYVTKPAAVRRTVRTIDLDSTGVWSSGRNKADSALAREAEAGQQADAAQAPQRRVSGA